MTGFSHWYSLMIRDTTTRRVKRAGHFSENRCIPVPRDVIRGPCRSWATEARVYAELCVESAIEFKTVPRRLSIMHPRDFRENLIVDHNHPILVQKGWRDHDQNGSAHLAASYGE